MSEKRVARGVDGDESHSPSPGPPEVTITPDLSEDEGGEKNGADVVVEHESDDEDSGSAADDKEQPKAKPKKPILVNIFLRCTSNDLVSEPDGLKTFLEKNDIGVKEVQASAEPSWVRLGQVELEQTEDRDKAVALCGQTLAGKELRVERARDSVNDRLYAPDDCILFVRNLAKSVTEEMLHTLFPKAKEVRLPRKNGKNRGFAFINFASKKEVDDLIRERQSEEHDGKTLKLGTYTSRDRSDRRNKGTPAKKSPSAKSQTSKSGKSGSKSGNRQQYGNYGAGRYQGRIQPLLDMDTSSFRNRGQYGFQDYDDYGFYNDFSQDFSLGSYLYDLHSRMGLESGLVKRMGMSRGFSGYDYGLDSNGLYGFGNLGYGQRMDGNRQGGFSGYRGLGGYSDGNNYRQSEKKRNKSGGNRTAKGKSGWPAK